MKYKIRTVNKTEKKKKAFSERYVFYKITINDAGSKEDVYEPMVALKERGSPTSYGSELMVSPLHLVSCSSQFGVILWNPRTVQSERGTQGSLPKPRQAWSEQVAQGRAQSHLVLKASKDGEPRVLLGSLCAGHKKQGMWGKREDWEERERKEKGMKKKQNNF